MWCRPSNELRASVRCVRGHRLSWHHQRALQPRRHGDVAFSRTPRRLHRSTPLRRQYRWTLLGCVQRPNPVGAAASTTSEVTLSPAAAPHTCLTRIHPSTLGAQPCATPATSAQRFVWGPPVTPPPPPPPSPLLLFTLDGASAGLRFDGHGLLSAGASSRHLRDHPDVQRSQILDYLFKPQFGALLDII